MADFEKLSLQSPLVLWVETFKATDGHPLEYHDLFDGVFLNDVMQQIDTRSAYENVNRCVEDVSVRLHNWDLLVTNIRGFYSDVLQQLLVIRLPNISVICRDPGKEASFAEIRKAVLLILGCAVQCEQKETFIDKIMSMDIAAQTEIVENIKEVTDDCETILPIQRPESPCSFGPYIDKMFHHMHRLIRERDECSELSTELAQERHYYMSQAEGRHAVDAPQISPDRHHIALELSECKANLRQLRQQLEDRQECLSDLKEEYQESVASCAQLKSENALLVQEARTARLLRDELDIMKEKAFKVDMFEKEILKYKERLNELEFYKARTVELKEDNAILEETKAMLEDQLSSSRKRIETVSELECQLGRYRKQIEELSKDRESDKEKIGYLTQENAQLELQRKTRVNESSCLEAELSATKSRIADIGCSLSEQLFETSHTRILRLELENQRLASTLSEIRKNELTQSAEKSLDLEKENQRLVKKADKLQSSSCKLSQQLVQMENELSSAREEKDGLLRALDISNDKSEQHICELERQIEQLSQALNQLRDRSDKSNDLKVKDLERENKRLHESVAGKNLHLSKLEFENRQLQRSSVQLQELTHRVQELEQDNNLLEKQNADLRQKVAALEHTSNKLESIEQENSDMSVEKRKLQKTVESLQIAVQRKEQLELDHISLLQEHQHAQRMLDTLKTGSDRALELESEKEDLNKELQQLRKLLDGQKMQKLKQEQMEFEVIDMGNENQRLQKNLEVTLRRLHQLEEDNMDIETDNEKISKELETLRVTVKRLENRDSEATQLEVEAQRLHKDKAVLEKENRKLKQVCELKDSCLDDINAKYLTLNQECKCLKQSVEKMKETCYKVKEFEKENKELLQELNTDRRTLAALREDLVNEKIRSQDLSNDLDQLTGELEKVGIDTDKLTAAEQTKDANRYKALETMIEETLKKSRELKDEKIRALETRLEESKNRNLQLQGDLIAAKRDHEMLKQRVEEDDLATKGVADRSIASKSYVKAKSAIATKEILQLERQNATLLAETDNLRSNNINVNEQCHKLETQLSNLHSQHATLQGHYSSLREQNAKLQVEYTTLQAQISSATSQQGFLKNQLSHLEAEHESLAHQHESLQNTHQSLVSDHESLQTLHEQLTLEFESLVSEHTCLKALHKSCKLEIKDSQDQLEVYIQGKDDLNRLRVEVERERERMKREVLSLGNLQADYHVLREDHSHLRAAFDKLTGDYSAMLAYHKQVKTDYNLLQLRVVELQGDLSEARENVAGAEMEFEKLENKMETIYHINERIENENQALLMQIKQLLNQNQELLTQALNSKDHFAEEEKAYMEKLSELRRQKERLEEKIMDSYKNRLSPKRKGLGALIARKARGIMSRGPRRSKSRNNLPFLLDNSSHGSGSTEQANDGHQPLDDLTSLLSATPSFLTGAKSTEDVNISANSQASHKPAVTTQKLGSKMQERPSPVRNMLTVEDGGMSTWNTVDSNLSDDSCADELRALELVQHRLSNDSQSRGSSEASNTSSDQWHPQRQRAVLSENGYDLSTGTICDSQNSGISSQSVRGHTESLNIYSRQVLSQQLYLSSTPSSSSRETVPPNLHGHASSSRPSEKNRTSFQMVAAHNCYLEGNQTNWRQEHNCYLEGNQTNWRQEHNCYLEGNQTNWRQEHNSYTNNTTRDKQHPSLRSGESGPSPYSPASVSPRPISETSHQLQNSLKRYNRDQCPVPTDPSPVIPITEQLDLLAISVLSDGTPASHYPRPDTDRHISMRHSNHNEGPISLDRKRFQVSLAAQCPHPLLATEKLLSADTRTLDDSAFRSCTAPNSLSHSLYHGQPASAVGQPSHARGTYPGAPNEARQHGQQLEGNLFDPGHGAANGAQPRATRNVNNSSITYSHVAVAERPRSVPPHLFYQVESERDMAASPACRSRDMLGTVSRPLKRDVPDGRDPRESQSFLNYGLARETAPHGSQSASYSLESQVPRQPSLQGSLRYQQQPASHSQHNTGCSPPSNKRPTENKSLPTSSQLPPTVQELSRYSPSPACSGTARPHPVDQSPLSSRLNTQPLPQQNQVPIESRWQRNRDYHDHDTNKAAVSKSTLVRRSHSSVASFPRESTSTRGGSVRRCNLPASEHDSQGGSFQCSADSAFQHATSHLHRSPSNTDRESRQYRGHTQDALVSSAFDGCTPYQGQKLSNTSFNNPLSSNTQPSHRSPQHHIGNSPSKSNMQPSHRSPQHHIGNSPSKSNIIPPEEGSSRPVGPHSYQTHQAPARGPDKQTPTPQQDTPATVQIPEELPSPVNKAAASPPQPKVSPQAQAVPGSTKAETKIEGGHPPNTNSIWYEYGCV